MLYRYREIVKKQGSRDWTKWVVETAGLPRSTAYDWIDEWEKSIGLVPDGHDESHPSVETEGNPNPTVPEREVRGSTVKSPVELDDTLVKVHLGDLRKSRKQRDRFVEIRLYEPGRVRRILEAAFEQIIGKESGLVDWEDYERERKEKAAGASSASLVPQPAPAPATA